MQNVIIVNAENVKVIALAYGVFKDSQKTALWLRTANQNLGGFSPLHLMQKKRTKQLLQIMFSDADEAVAAQKLVGSLEMENNAEASQVAIPEESDKVSEP